MSKSIRPYTYDTLCRDLKEIGSAFGNVEIGTIGKSVWGKELYYIKLGTGPSKIMYNGAHHGMEWITSAMLMRFVRDFLKSEKNAEAFKGFNVRALAKRATLYVVPMVNPDGVALATEGIPKTLDTMRRQKLLRLNGSAEFQRWQANANGVDLNHNYDAMWQKSKALETEYGIYAPGPTRFSGMRPESEPESHALAQFTRQHKFDLTISFHSQGKVIYHGFGDKEPPGSLKIAKAFTKISPYQLDEADGIAACGGFKDWFVDKFNRPGYTVEVGLGKNPLPITQLPQICDETFPILLGAMTVDFESTTGKSTCTKR